MSSEQQTELKTSLDEALTELHGMQNDLRLREARNGRPAYTLEAAYRIYTQMNLVLALQDAYEYARR
ncbi:hypothetical protein KY363_01330 [Candidatus Woesearchaeota archaeon]|nr:hypothetical protein [Candidatus Woesearchaeota archaeon]